MLGSTEAIEDLGVYTNISMIESTEAFRKFAGDKAWSQLDFQTQQQIRLAAILEQTYARYGNTLADTTQTRQAQFVASLKNIQLSLGQAFLPIYNAVLPLLTAMANAIGKVVNLIAQFTTAIFGSAKGAKTQATAISNQVSGMQDLGEATEGAGKAAKKAGKEAKGALAGFDEINTLSIPSSSDSGADGGSGGGAGGIGGGGIGGMEIPALDTGGFASSTVEVTERVQAMVNRVKGALNSLKDFFKENASTIKSVLAGLVAGIGALIGLLIYKHWDVLMLRLSKSTGFFGTVFKSIKSLGAVLSTITAPMLAVAALVGLVVGTLVNLWLTNEEFRTKVTDAWNGIVSVVKNLWGTVLKPVLVIIGETLMDIWNDAIKPLWDNWKEFVKQIVLLMIDLWNGIKPVFDWIVKTFGPVIVEIFNGIFNQIKNIVKLIIDIVGSLIGAFSGIISGIRQIFNGLIDFIAGVFTGNWSRAWDGIKNIFSGVKTVISSVWEGIKNVFGSILSYVGNTFKNIWNTAWNSVKTIFSNVFNSFKSIASSVFNSISSVISNIVNGIKNTISGIKTVFSNVFHGLLNIVKAPLNSIAYAINNTLGRISISIPNWVPGIGGKSFSIPKIPYLAKGGIVDSPTLAMVGEAGKEAVMPLENNTGWITELAEKLATRIPQTGNSSLNGDVIFQIDGSVIGKVALKELRKMQRQGGITIIPT